MQIEFKKFIVPILVLILSLATFIAYSPGFSGDFIFDDIVNISLNYRSHLDSLTLRGMSQVWNSGVASDLGRPLSMLTFGFNYYFTGLDPRYFKLTNVFIHLLNAFLIYFLTKELLGIEENRRKVPGIPKQYLALLITACWTLHPLHVSTVLYAVQRMTQLGVLFSLLAILLYCKARQSASLTPFRSLLSLAGIGLLIGLGVLGKENAILTVPFIAVIEFTLFGLRTYSSQQQLFQRSFFFVFLLIPGSILSVYLLLNPAYILDGYALREFTIYERLLTESRVLWDYIGWILTPDTRAYTFYYENYPLSTGLLSPPSTLFAIIGILLLGASVFLLNKHLPWISFGIAFFLAGHALESTIVALELVFEHRNYLPAYGLLFGLIATLFRSPLPLLSKPFGVTFSAAFLILLVHGTYLEAAKWSSTPNFLFTLLKISPDSYRVNYTLGHVYFTAGLNSGNEDYLRDADRHFVRAIELDERNIAAHVGLIMTNDVLETPTTETVEADFIRRIQNYPLGASGVIALHNLERCYFATDCNEARTVDLFARAVTATAQNTVMSGAEKQTILSELAGDILLTFRRVNEALALYYLAADMTDELTINDIRIIFLEMDRRNYAAARAQVLKAENKPGGGLGLRQSLRDVKSQLQKLN